MPKLLDAAGLRQTVVAALARREYSRRELENKYKSKAASYSELTSLLDDLQSRDWQSDRRFASAKARSRIQKNYGREYIQCELVEKGISRDIIDSVFEELDVDWLAHCSFVVTQKLRSNLRHLYENGVTTPPDDCELSQLTNKLSFESKQKVMSKIFRHLTSRGFRSYEINQSLKILGL